MSNIWFTSDTHFGHKNIIQFESIARPFKDLDEMHEVMIERWNSVVKPNDTVYHLGDVAFGTRWLKLLSRLHGRKRLVMGNHDTYRPQEYLQYFERLYGAKFWERCILTHIPVHPRQLGSRFMLNVHGHLHSNFVYDGYECIQEASSTKPLTLQAVIDKNYFNVSVEQNNLHPIHADVIRDRIKELAE